MLSPHELAIASAIFIAAIIAYIAPATRAYACPCLRQSRRSLGSGENKRWNRLVRTDKPVFPSNRRYELEHHWVYADAPDATTSAVGTCPGRQVWTVDKKATPVPSTFDAFANPNASDSLLRSQLLRENMESSEKLGPASSPEEALVRGWEVGCCPARPPPSFTPNLRVPSTRSTGRDSSARTATGRATMAVRLRPARVPPSPSRSQRLGPAAATATVVGAGPMFLLPGLVITCHIVGGDILGPERRSAMVTYLRNHQQTDGGWCVKHALTTLAETSVTRPHSLVAGASTSRALRPSLGRRCLTSRCACWGSRRRILRALRGGGSSSRTVARR